MSCYSAGSADAGGRAEKGLFGRRRKNDAGVDGPGVVAVELGREWILLLAAAGVSPTRLARSAEISAMAGMAQCRVSRRDAGVVEGLSVPAPSCPNPKPTV